MSRFAYTAMSDLGQRRQGTVRSRSPQEAARKLLEMGYHPVSVEPLDGASVAGRRSAFRVFRRVRITDLAVITRQLAALLKAGLPLIQTLSTLHRQCSSRRLADVLGEIEESLTQDAGTFSDALDSYPEIFDPVYRGLVRSGEQSGNLAEVLQQLSGHLGQSAKLRGEVRGAFIYPAFLLVLGSGAVFVLMSFVIPKFRDLFTSFGRTLPWPTRVLMNVSTFMASWWWAVLAGAVAALLLVLAMLRRPRVREWTDLRLLRLPVVGSMLQKVEIARISHTFAVLLNSGVPILSCISITRDTARNLALRATFAPIGDAVAAGEPLAGAMERTGLYPPLVISLIRTGEDTGELPEMLIELSKIYEDEASRTVTGAVKLLEPVLIVFMGGIIAGIVAAVILPVFRANLMVGS